MERALGGGGEQVHAWWLSSRRCFAPPYLVTIYSTSPWNICPSMPWSLRFCCLLSVIAYLGRNEKVLVPKFSQGNCVKMLGVLWVRL